MTYNVFGGTLNLAQSQFSDVVLCNSIRRVLTVVFAAVFHVLLG